MLNESILLCATETLEDQEKEDLISMYNLDTSNGMAEDPRTVVAVQPQLCGVKK